MIARAVTACARVGDSVHDVVWVAQERGWRGEIKVVSADWGAWLRQCGGRDRCSPACVKVLHCGIAIMQCRTNGFLYLEVREIERRPLSSYSPHLPLATHDTSTSV
jgi:hypothetical protein